MGPSTAGQKCALYPKNVASNYGNARACTLLWTLTNDVDATRYVFFRGERPGALCSVAPSPLTLAASIHHAIYILICLPFRSSFAGSTTPALSLEVVVAAARFLIAYTPSASFETSIPVSRGPSQQPPYSTSLRFPSLAALKFQIAFYDTFFKTPTHLKHF